MFGVVVAIRSTLAHFFAQIWGYNAEQHRLFQKSVSCPANARAKCARMPNRRLMRTGCCGLWFCVENLLVLSHACFLHRCHPGGATKMRLANRSRFDDERSNEPTSEVHSGLIQINKRLNPA